MDNFGILRVFFITKESEKIFMEFYSENFSQIFLIFLPLYFIHFRIILNYHIYLFIRVFNVLNKILNIKHTFFLIVNFSNKKMSFIQVQNYIIYFAEVILIFF